MVSVFEFTVILIVPWSPSQAQEAMRRAKFKFPGRQKIVVSRNWGFTSYSREDYVQWKREGRLVKDGVNAKVRPRQCCCMHISPTMDFHHHRGLRIWAATISTSLPYSCTAEATLACKLPLPCACGKTVLRKVRV